MKKVYIAAPYTKGDVVVNTRNAILVADQLRARGFTPFVPHLTHFWHMIEPHDWGYWLRYDKEWLGVCDCLLRVDGDSKGADMEVQWAKEQGIPIYYSIEELQQKVS